MKHTGKVKLLRITTVSSSLRGLLRGQLRFMSEFFETHAASNPGWELDNLKSEENTESHPISIERAPAPIKDLKSLQSLRRLIRKLKPDIVHTHTPKAGLLGMLAAYLCHVPIRLHTVAGLPWMESEGNKKRLLMFMERLTYIFSTHVYCNSHRLRDFILKNDLIAESKISVIGNGSSNGVDTNYYLLTDELKKEAFSLRQKYGWEDEKVILFVGRLVKDKGIEELLRAFKNIKQNCKVKLLLVGPFEEDRDPLSDWAMKMIDSDPDIVNTGFVKDVRPYIAVSHILAFPSYREGFPNVPMQAGALGIPQVVTNINGCNEIVVDRKNGLIVPPKDANALEKGILTVLENEKLYQQLSLNSRPMIVERFGQQYLWALILEEYKKHLAKIGAHV